MCAFSVIFYYLSVVLLFAYRPDIACAFASICKRWWPTDNNSFCPCIGIRVTNFKFTTKLRFIFVLVHAQKTRHKYSLLLIFQWLSLKQFFRVGLLEPDFVSAKCSRFQMLHLISNKRSCPDYHSTLSIRHTGCLLARCRSHKRPRILDKYYYSFQG